MDSKGERTMSQDLFSTWVNARQAKALTETGGRWFAMNTDKGWWLYCEHREVTHVVCPVNGSKRILGFTELTSVWKWLRENAGTGTFTVSDTDPDLL